MSVEVHWENRMKKPDPGPDLVTHWLCHLCCEAQFAHLLLVEDIAVVIACAVLYLLLVGIDACTYRCRCGEVECCALYRCYATVRY